MTKISIVIPVYNEKGLAKTLANLTLQTAIKDCEIIISEYNPDFSNFTKQIITHFRKDYKIIPITHHIVDKPLISYSRNEGFLKSKGQFFINFDGDTRFNHHRAIEQLIKPLEEGEAQLTICNNEFDLIGLSNEELKKMIIPQQAYDQLNNAQVAGFPIFEPGSCFTRESFTAVGGFNEVKQWELMILGPRFMLRGYRIKYIPTVSVISSPRRVLKLDELGLGILDYNNAIRENKVIKMT